MTILEQCGEGRLTAINTERVAIAPNAHVESSLLDSETAPRTRRFATDDALPHSGPTFQLDRHLVLALLLVALAVIPRSLLIARSHSETIDAEYHIVRGLAYWTGTDCQAGPVAERPAAGRGAGVAADPGDQSVRRARSGRCPDLRPAGRAERLAVRCAVWNSLLFLPLVATLFVWCRKLYGLRAAWLACGLLAVEPNFAAHLPLTTLDVVGVTGIVIGCFFAWRYFERPSRGGSSPWGWRRVSR